MKDTNFTKGEWKVTTTKTYSGGIITHRINSGEMSFLEGISNARLIAAAPEMHAMLERASNSNYLKNSEYHKEIQDLLSKARGES